MQLNYFVYGLLAMRKKICDFLSLELKLLKTSLSGLLQLVITNNEIQFCDHKRVGVQLNYSSWSN